MKKLILFTTLMLTIALGGSTAQAATEFVCTIQYSGGDYSTLALWQADNQCDLTAAATRVFSGTKTLTVNNGATVTLYRVGVAQDLTGTVCHAGSTQILVKSISGTATPQADDLWWVDASNYFTISNAGDSAIAVAKIDGAWSGADSSVVSIDGWTTSAANYVRIYTTSTARHSGSWDTDAYRLEATAGANDTNLIEIKENYVRVEGLQVHLTNSGLYTGCRAINVGSQDGTSDIRINNNIIKGSISVTNGTDSEGIGIYADNANTTATIYNNIIYDFINGSVANNAGITTATGGTYNLYNNTLYGNFIGINAAGATTVLAKNNLANGNTTDYSGTFDSNSTNNLSEDATAPAYGTSYTSKVVTFMYEGSDDFHLGGPDTEARDKGADLSVTFTTDIDDQTRTGTWDIGADEITDSTAPNLSSDAYTHSTKELVLTFDDKMDASAITYGSFELADAADPETAYPAGNADMTGNVLLMHLNETGANAEEAGTISDTSGKGNNGTLYTGSDGLNKSTTGKFGGAMSFDGSGDYITLPNSVLGPTAQTISLWMRTEHLGIEAMIIGNNGFSVSGHTGTALRLGSDGRIGMLVAYNGVGEGYKTGTSPVLTDNIWHHIAMTWDGTTGTDNLIFYTDGIKTGSQSIGAGSTAVTSYDVTIGKNPTASNLFFNGTIDEVAVFNRALTEDEILDHYKRGALRLKYQVRSGDTNPPTGDFIGPDGTAADYYEELDDNSGALPSFDLTNVADNQYFQYKVYFETDNSSYSPELKSVVVPVNTDDTQAEFDAGTYNATQWDGTNNWLELDATGLTNGSGDYTSSVKDAGSVSSWDSIAWTPQRPLYKELPDNTAGGNSFVLTSSDAEAEVDGTTLTFTLTLAHQEAIAGWQAAGTETLYLAIAADGAKDMSGNGIAAVSRQAVDTWTKDDAVPTLSSDAYTHSTKELVLTFDDKMDASAITYASFELADAASAGNSFVLSSSDAETGTDGTTLTFTLTTVNQEAIAGWDAAGTETLYLAIAADGAKDMSGNGIAEVTRQAIDTWTKDETAPSLSSDAYTHSTKALVLTFDDKMDASAITYGSFELADTDSGGNSFNLSSSDAETGTDGTTLTFTLTTAHQETIAGWDVAGTTTLYLAIAANGAKDMSGNGIAAVTRQAIDTWTKDTALPTLSSDAYTHSTKELVLTFDENIDTTETTETSFELADDPTAGNSFTLTETAAGSDGTTLTFTLTTAHQEAIAGWQAAGTTTLYLAIAADGAKDMSGNGIAAVTRQAIDTWNKDETAPSLSSDAYTHSTKALVLTFDDKMDASAITYGSFELADTGLTALETAYPTGNADMTGNVLLMHMNETGGTIVDYSGEGNNGTYNGALYSQTGKLNTAIGFDGSDDVVNIPAENYIDGTDDWTITYWFNSDALYTGSDYKCHIDAWLQGTNAMYLCTFDDGKFYFKLRSAEPVEKAIDSNIALSVNKWTFVALGRSGTDMFLQVDDNVMETTDLGAGFVVNTPADFELGHWNTAARHYDGMMDEFAVWNRALSADEVLDHYKRGALRLKYQVRSGATNPPTGDFIGPDGTAADYYEELDDNSVALPSFDLTNVADNQYFQYKVYFETDNSSYSPELKSVVVPVNTDDTQAEFDAGTYNATQWDGTNNWLELDATGLTNGSGDYTSSVKDAGSVSSWDSIAWTPQRPLYKELPDAGGGNSFTLTSEDAETGADGTTLTFTLTDTHQETVAGWDAAGTETLYLAIAADGAKDMSGNGNEAIACQAVDTWTKDTTSPNAPTGASFTATGNTVVSDYINDTNTGFTVSFTSPVSEYEGTAHLYVGGSLLAADVTVAVTAGSSPYDLTGNAQSITDLGADAAKTLTVKIIDISGNVGAVSNDVNITKDTAPPTLSTDAYTHSTKELVLTFDDKMDASAITYGSFELADTLTAGNSFVLTSSDAEAEVDGTTLTFTLTDTHRDTIAGWDAAGVFGGGWTTIGTHGAGDDQFWGSQGITCDDTYVYVADVLNHRIVKRLKSDLSYVAKIGTEGAGDDQFQYPFGITSDDTHVYVADSNNHRIVKRLKSDLSYVAQIGSSGTGDDQFSSPRGIACDDTYIYVVDTYNHRIVKRLKSDLSYVAKLGSNGSGDDQFNAPHGIAFDDTHVYVADQGNDRIVKRLKSDLSYVAQIGSLGSGDDQFSSPRGITCDDTYIYVADYGNHRIVKRLKSDLSYVAQIGSLGSGDDQFNYPSGIAFDDTHIYVADTNNYRIVKFASGPGSLYLAIAADGAKDMSGNGIAAVSRQAVDTWNKDTTAPSLSSDAYTHSSKELVLTFDDKMDASAITYGSFELADTDSGGNSFNLSSSDVETGSDGTTLTFTLTLAHQEAIAGWQAAGTTTLYLAIALNGAKDMSGNGIAAVSRQAIDTWNKDTTAPTLSSDAYTHSTKALVLTFDDKMDASAITYGSFELADTDSGGNSFNLSSSDVETGSDGTTLTFTLTTVNQEAIAGWQAAGTTTLYLAIAANGAKDMSGNGIAAVSRQAVDTWNKDTTAPSLTADEYTHSTKELVLTFDDKMDASAITYGSFELADTLTAGNSFNLSSSDVETGTDGTTLTFTLTVAHQETIAGWQAAGTTTLYLAIAASGAKDMSGNGIAAITRQAVDTWTKDETAPSLTADEYTHSTKELVLTFDDKMDASAITYGSFELADTLTAGNSFVLTSSDAEAEVDGTTLTFTLTDAHRDTIAGWDAALKFGGGWTTVGTLGSGDDQFNDHRGIACDDTHIYVADYYNHRIQKRLKSDLSYVAKIGTLGTGDDQFNRPAGITCDDTHIYVADYNNHRIQKRLKSDLSYVAKIGTLGTGDDQFTAPAGITCDDTHIYVADTNNHRIQKRLKSDLSYVAQIGTLGTGDDQFTAPAGITCDDTHLYVADTSNRRIVKRLKTDALTYVSKIGTNGSGDDQFTTPYGITCDDTHIYVADSGSNDRIQKRLKSDLSYVAKIGTLGTGDGQFNDPRGITCDDTHLYVVDTYNSRVVKCNSGLEPTLYLAIALNGAKDMSGNGIAEVTRQAIDTWTKDETAPSLTADEYTHSTKELVLTFDENIDTSVTTSTSFTLADAVSAGNSFTLTETAAGTDGTALTFTLTTANQEAIAGWQAAGTTTLYLAIAADGAKDMSGNGNAAVSRQAIDTWNKDTTAPSLTADEYTHSTKALVLTFNDKMDASVITYGSFELSDALTAGNSLVLSASDVETGTDGTTLTFTLTTANQEAIAGWQAAGTTTLYLAIAADGAKDMSGNGIAAVTRQAIDTWNKDTTAPSLTADEYTHSTKALVLTFDDKMDASAITYGSFELADTDSGGNSFVLTTDDAEAETDGTTLTFTLTTAHRDTVAGWDAAGKFGGGWATIGTVGAGDDQFNGPHNIACDDTHVYVADQGNHRIIKRLKSDLSYVAQIGSSGAGDDQFNAPHGIVFDDTHIYVADTFNHRIIKRLKSDLSYVSKIGTQGSGDDQFNIPIGITCDDTHLYVADYGNHRIIKRLKSDLSYVSQIGSSGSGNDQFYAPQGITCDDTHLYVADTNNHRIQKRLKSDLSYVAKLGSSGSGDDQFNYPSCIAFDDTHVYVADTYNNRIVKRLKSDLSYVAQIGSYGSGDDQFYYPSGITSDDTYIYVADRSNHRIVKCASGAVEPTLYLAIAADGAKDMSGNGNEAIARQAVDTWTRDTTSPDAPTGASFVATGGTVVSDYINNTNTGFIVSFTSPVAEYEGTAHLYADGSLLAADVTVAVTAGSSPYDLTGNAQSITDLGADAAKTLTVKIIDTSGNVGAVSNNVNITKETVDPTFSIGYYTDSGCTGEFSGSYMKAGTYYIKITSNETLNGTPTISIDAEGTVTNDVTDAATSLLSGNDYVYTRVVATDAAAVGSTAEIITITGMDTAGNTAADADVTDEKYTDTTVPGGGSISYTDGGTSSTTAAITLSEGSDTGGIATRALERAWATYTSDTVGGYSAFSNLYNPSEGAVSYDDTTLELAKAYKYRYVIEDNAGNSTTYTSASQVKVEGAIADYTVTNDTPQIAGAGWTETVTAYDVNDNTVTSDSSTAVEMSNTIAGTSDAGHAKFYADGDYDTVAATYTWTQTSDSDFNTGSTASNVSVGSGDVTLYFIGTYVPSGTLISSAYDTTTTSNFKSISWSATTPTDTTVKFQIATNTDNATWTFLGSDGTADTYYTASGQVINSSHNDDRYIKYKAYLDTGNPAVTPTLSDVTIDDAPEISAYTLTGGEATIYVMDETAETITITATDANTKTGTSGNIVVGPAAASNFVITTGAGYTMAAGESKAIDITAYDTCGNLTPAYTGEKTLTFSGASTSTDGNPPTIRNKNSSDIDFTEDTLLDFTSGASSSVVLKLYCAEEAAIKAADIVNSVGTTADDDLEITVSPETAVKVVFKQEPTTTGVLNVALTPDQPIVAIRDTYGNQTADTYSIKLWDSSTTGTLPAHYNDASGTLISSHSDNTLAAAAGEAQFSGVTHDTLGNIYLYADCPSESQIAPDFSAGITFSSSVASTVELPTEAVENFPLIPTNDTAINKFEVLKFKVKDADSGDLIPTLIDEIQITVGGTHAVSTTDIAWAGLYVGESEVATAAGSAITNTSITFGSTPDDASDADLSVTDLDIVADNTSTEFIVYIYMTDEKMDAVDGQTFTFAVNEDGIGVDTGTSSRMTANNGNVSTVTGTIAVAVSHLEIVDADTGNAALELTAGTPDELTVRATDANKNIDADYTGNHTLVFTGLNNSPGGDVPKIEAIGFDLSTTINFSSGLSPTGGVTLTAYKAETQDISVSETGESYSCHTLEATVSVDDAENITLVSGDDQIGAVSTALSYFVVAVKDIYDNPVSGETVDFTVSSYAGSGYSLSSAQEVTAVVTGEAQTRLTLGGTGGLYEVEAASGTLTGSPVTFSATALAPTELDVVSGTPQSDGVTLAVDAPLIVKLRDASNYGIPNENITFEITSNPTNATGHSLTGGDTTYNTTTNSSGQAQTALTLGNKSGSYPVTATWTDGVSLTYTADFIATAIAGSAYQVGLSGPASVVAAEVSTAITVAAQDQYGNNTNTATAITFSLGTSATATGTFYSDSAGDNSISEIEIPASGDPQSPSTATFYYSDTVTGTPTLTAARTGGGALTVASDTLGISIVPAGLSYFTVSASDTSAMDAGDEREITVTAYDGENNIKTDLGSTNIVFSGAATSPSPASASPTCSNNTPADVDFGSNTLLGFSSGVAAATLKVYTAETIHIKATVGLITTTADNDLDIVVSHDTEDHLKFSANIPTPGGGFQAGEAFPLGTLHALDLYSNLATAYSGAKTVNYTLAHVPADEEPTDDSPDGYYSDSYTTTVAFTSGASTSTLTTTLYRAQTITITPVASGLAGVNTASNSIEIGALTIDKLSFNQQPSTTCLTNVVLGQQPIVAVADQYGNPISGSADQVTLAASTTTGTYTAVTNGDLSAAALQVEASEGLATFAGVKYSYPEQIYLRASVATPGVDDDYSHQITFSIASDDGTMEAGTLDEPTDISSIKDTFAEKVDIFDFKITDAGTDGYGLTLTKIVITRGTADTTDVGEDADGWTDYIEAAYITDGDTPQKLAISVANDAITFGDGGSTLYTVENTATDGTPADKTYTLSIYLKDSLPIGADGKTIAFDINPNDDISVETVGSGFDTGDSVTGSTDVEVTATKFIVTGSVDYIAAGVGSTLSSITATDTNDNIDTDYTDSKEIIFSGATPAPSEEVPTYPPTCNGVDFGNPTGVNFVSGESTTTITMLLYKLESAAIKATCGLVATSDADAHSIIVTGGDASELAWYTQPNDTVVANAPWKAFKVSLTDDYGNISPESKTVTVTPTGATFNSATGANEATAVSGVATFSNFRAYCASYPGPAVTLNATADDVTESGASSAVTIVERYNITIRVPDIVGGGDLDELTLTIRDPDTGEMVTGLTNPISGNSPLTDIYLPYGAYQFNFEKELYVELTVNKTASTSADGADSYYDNNITWEIPLTSIAESLADYRVLTDFVYDEDDDILYVSARLERRGQQILDSTRVGSELQTCTLRIYDSDDVTPKYSASASGADDLGNYWFIITDAVTAEEFTSGKSYFAGIVILYGSGVTGDANDALNVTYSASTTFDIGVTAQLKVWTEEIKEEVSDVKTKVETEADITRTAVTTARTSIESEVAAKATATQAKVGEEATETQAKVVSETERTIGVIGGDDLETGETIASRIAITATSRILNLESYVRVNDTLTVKYKTDTGLSPVISVYDATNTLCISEQKMTENVSGSGIYEYDVKFIWGRGEHTIICQEVTKGTLDGINIAVISTDLEDISTTATTTMAQLANIDTDQIGLLSSSVEGINSVISSIVSNIDELAQLSSKVRELTESTSSAIYLELEIAMSKLKEINEGQGIKMERMYDLSEEQSTNVGYIKNKTLEIKSLVELTQAILSRTGDTPIVKTWMESGAPIEAESK